MALYNINQILKGARNAGGLKTYSQASVTTKPTAAIAGTTITFTDGAIEVEGKEYAFPTPFDFSTYAALLRAGTTYTLSAVPAYTVPADQSAAISAGVNYVVTQTALGESVLNYFINPLATTGINALGGEAAVRDRIQSGTATDADQRAFAFFWSEQDKLSDPRYTGQTLPITAIKYVLTEVTAQNNTSKANALANFTYNEFARFRAGQGDIPAEFKVLATAAAVTAYETPSKTFLCKRIFGYTSLNNANANIGGVEIATYTTAGALLTTPFTNPTNISTGVAVASLTHFVVYEYYYSSYMELGNVGTKDKVLNILSNKEASGLGRINPIYLDNPFSIQRSALMNAKARPAMTLYNNPCDLVKVTVVSLGPVVLGSLVPVYDTLV